MRDYWEEPETETSNKFNCSSETLESASSNKLDKSEELIGKSVADAPPILLPLSLIPCSRIYDLPLLFNMPTNRFLSSVEM